MDSGIAILSAAISAAISAASSPVSYAILAMSIATRLVRRGPVSAWLFGLPGIIVHEMSHWAVAKLTGGRPMNYRPWPGRMEDGAWALGTVAITRLTWFNGAPIGLAPLLMNGLALWGWAELVTRAVAVTEPMFWWGSYLVAIALADGWPSRADYRIAGHSLTGIVVWCGIGYIVFRGITG